MPLVLIAGQRFLEGRWSLAKVSTGWMIAVLTNSVPNAPSDRDCGGKAAQSQSISAQFTIEAMKISHSLRWFFFLAAATATGFLTSSLHAATPEQQAVLSPVMALFDGMTKRDAEAIKKPLLTGGTMVLMRDGKPT